MPVEEVEQPLDGLLDGGRGEGGLDPVVEREHDAAGVAGLGETVGVEQQPLIGPEGDPLQGGPRGQAQGRRRVRRFQQLHAAARAQRGRMPAVDQAHLPGAEVGQQERHEVLVAQVGGDAAVEDAGEGDRIGFGGGGLPEGAQHGRADPGRVHAVSSYVPDEQPRSGDGERHVVQIAAEQCAFGGGARVRGEGEAADLGRHGPGEGPLGQLGDAGHPVQRGAVVGTGAGGQHRRQSPGGHEQSGHRVVVPGQRRSRGVVPGGQQDRERHGRAREGGGRPYGQPVGGEERAEHEQCGGRSHGAHDDAHGDGRADHRRQEQPATLRAHSTPPWQSPLPGK